MTTTIGLFGSRAAAEAALAQLRAEGFSDDQLNLLAPGARPPDIERVPSSDTEQPGTGAAVGGVVGGVAGAAGGMAVASAFLPGVGPVVALGLLAGAVLSLWGAATGAALEDALAEGVPRDELFLYEDAVRSGRSIVFVWAEDQTRAEAARRIMREMGTEELDTARERWWVGLRSAEAERYTADGGDFDRDEARYRLGFAAALGAKTRGRTYDDVVEYLRDKFPDAYRDPAFRRGFERGRAYDLGMRRAA